MFENMSQERGLGPKTRKESVVARFRVVSWQTVGQGDGGRCWGGVDNVVVIVGLGVHKREPGEGDGA